MAEHTQHPNQSNVITIDGNITAIRGGFSVTDSGGDGEANSATTMELVYLHIQAPMQVKQDPKWHRLNRIR